MARQDTTAGPGTWSGVIINSGCTSQEAFNEADKCYDRVPAGKLSLYDDTTRVIYELDAQVQAGQHFGDAVIVRGDLEGNSIHVTSIETLTKIGLPVGSKAPGFTAIDQFGREHTLDSLRGEHGTVLLFFRSADW